jgi:NADPH:quinone reductase-like Zn-dependent oxidoreductase
MRALVSTPDGRDPGEIREVAEPQPQPTEAVIEVKAISLNRGELRQLAAYADWVPGQDVAGVVLRAAGDGSGPPVGSRVAALVDEGGWAERVAAPTSRIGVLPDNVPFGAAATLGVAGMTALRALRVGGSLLNARVLVTGASGGVGRFAVQLATLGGAETTAVVGAPERGRGLDALGAARVVLGSEALAGPFELVMEGVGGPSLERSVRALAPGGIVVLYGGASGAPAAITLGHFSGRPGARVQGFFVFETGEETFGSDVAYLARLIGQGRLRAEIGLEVSWRELGRATAALRDRQVNGKVVLTVD